MKKLGIFFILIIFFSKFSLLSAYSSDPKNFVSELVQDVISKLSSKSLSDIEKAKFVETVALENVDINALGLYTLGELRKSADSEDLENYQNAFKSYFLKSLTSRLTDYSSSRFEIIEAELKKVQATQLSSRK